MANTLVAGKIDGYYGSTHDEDLVIPLAMVTDNHPSPTSKNTKKLLCAVMIGLTVAVASSALLFFSIRESCGPASTEESFLLHASVGADDDKCVPASGPWPTGAASAVDDDGPGGPFVTCFVCQGCVNQIDHCWSHSYYDPTHGYWNDCTPNGFGAAGWSIDSPNDDDNRVVMAPTQRHNHPVESCGTACTEFSFDMPT